MSDEQHHVDVEEHCDGWWVTFDEDREYAGPFPSEDDAVEAMGRVAHCAGF